jgi:hypothetical protein
MRDEARLPVPRARIGALEFGEAAVEQQQVGGKPVSSGSLTRPGRPQRMWSSAPDSCTSSLRHSAKLPANRATSHWSRDVTANSSTRTSMPGREVSMEPCEE